MNSIVDRIFNTEDKAKAILEKAQSEASRILSQASKQAEEIISSAREAGLAKSRKLIEEAGEKAAENKKRAARELQAENEGLNEKYRDHMEKAADAALAYIMNPEQLR